VLVFEQRLAIGGDGLVVRHRRQRPASIAIWAASSRTLV
jgi:hypothetical protein